MDSNFPKCLAIILQSEGGFVDDPQDPGGATNLGITLHELSGWRGSTATIADVQALTPDSVSPIYKADYWNVTRCDALPVGLDLMVFDEAVNAGPGRAIRHLQTALGTVSDGIMGPHTLAAAGTTNLSSVINNLASIRDEYYKALPTFSHFGKGWLARVERTREAAINMIGAAT